MVTFQALSPKSAIWAQKLRFKIYDPLDRFDQKIAAILRCAVKESDWRLAWDTLQEPFIVMYPQQQWTMKETMLSQVVAVSGCAFFLVGGNRGHHTSYRIHDSYSACQTVPQKGRSRCAAYRRILGGKSAPHLRSPFFHRSVHRICFGCGRVSEHIKVYETSSLQMNDR